MKLILLILFSASIGFAQQKGKSYQAQIIVEEASVYKEANFDSEVIATIPGGETFDVSSKTFNGAFYRIRVKPGVIGYIPDSDIKTLFVTAAQKQSESKKAKTRDDRQRDRKKKRSFEKSRYAGFQYSMIEFQEDTMGGKRKDKMNFIGAKLSGPNWLIDGYPTDMNFLFSTAAPKYYETLTGHAADGWVFLADFLFQNYYPHGPNALTFFGFGPMLKFSRFNAQLTDATTGRTMDYSLQDISLGAAFNAGVGLKLDSVALRGELKYYWEKQPYWGASLSLQFNF